LVFVSFLTFSSSQYQFPLSIGFLLGVLFIMTQQMLIIFAIFTERSKDQSNTLSQTQATEAMAVFAFFLFFIYTMFGGMLAVFRDDVIKQGLYLSFVSIFCLSSISVISCRSISNGS
jgi:hypothetical protein